MKSFIVFAVCVAAVLAAPPKYNGNEKDAQVVVNDSNNIGVDGYQSRYETENGISENRDGQLTNAGTDDEAFVVRGSYSYPGPDGQIYTVNYVADAFGFHPEGAHLPKSP